jgi:hypothetical protein
MRDLKRDHVGRDQEEQSRRRSTVPAPLGRDHVRCEFTVAGLLGPVLAHACRPDSSASVRACTVIRARLPQGCELVELVRLLDARGVQLVAVTDLGPRPGG